MSTRTMTMSISADWLNKHIAELVDEGRLSLAYKTALGCTVNPDISEAERCGLALEVISGSLRFEDADEGAFTLEDTDKKACDGAQMLFDRIDELEEQLRQKEDAMAKLNEQLLFIHDFLDSEDSHLLYDLCDAYHDETGDFLYGKALVSTLCSSSFSSCDCFGVEMPPILADFLEASHGVESGKLEYGWLSPDGTFHEVEWGEHTGWAMEYIKEELGDDGISGIFNAGDYLVENGWVLMHNPMRGVGRATLSRDVKLTSAQKSFLHDYYTSWDKPIAADAAKCGYMEEVPEFFDFI